LPVSVGMSKGWPGKYTTFRAHNMPYLSVIIQYLSEYQGIQEFRRHVL
jgi:hypothetical protein